MTGAHDEEIANKPDSDEGTAKSAGLTSEQAGNPPESEGGSKEGRAESDQATAGNAEDPPTAPSTSDATPDEEETSDLELLEATPTPVVLPIRASEAPPSVPKRPPPVPSSARQSQTRPVVPAPLPSSRARSVPPPPPPPLPRATQSRKVAPSVSRPSPSPEDVSVPPPLAAPPAPAMMAPPVVSAALPSASGAIALQAVPLPAVTVPAPRAIEQERFAPAAAIADVRKRVEQAASGERAALARARTELGILLEVAGGDPAGALSEYRAAHGIAANLVAPLTAARRLTPLRPAAPALALLEAELRASNEPTMRVIRQIELGMLLMSSGAPAERAWQAYRDVLASQPSHPGALRGLETALSTAPRAAETSLQLETLAAHLENMAAVFRGDTKLSAWLEVERGQLLEKLGRADAARAAFEAALALDGQIGPVRDAYTRHLLLQGQVEALIEAWAAEAALETDGGRAARLLYVAGRLASERLDRKPLAIELLERAASSDAAHQATRHAALRELFHLYEAVGNVEAAVAAGNKVLAFARDAERAHWHRRMVQDCEALGRFAEMAQHAHQVLTAEPDDEPMRERLDHALATLGQHEQRVAMFADQAARASTQTARIELLLRAAAIAENDMARPDMALLSLRSAFATDASHADITDAIVRLLTPGTPPRLPIPTIPRACGRASISTSRPRPPRRIPRARSPTSKSWR